MNQLVLIIWEDAWEAWCGDCEELYPQITYTVGWIYKETKKGYAVTPHAYPDIPNSEEDYACFIRREMVREVIPIVEVNRKDIKPYTT